MLVSYRACAKSVFPLLFRGRQDSELWSDSRVSTLEFLTRRSIKHPIPEIYAASAALSGAVTLFADLATVKYLWACGWRFTILGCSENALKARAIRASGEHEPANFDAAERAPGFIGRAGYEGKPDRESWGVQVFPRFYVERGDGGAPSVLSLWVDIEKPCGIHLFERARRGDTARLRDGFCRRPGRPMCSGGCRKGIGRIGRSRSLADFELLHDRGPTPEAFTFKSPFDANGRPAIVDKERVRRLAAAGAT